MITLIDDAMLKVIALIAYLVVWLLGHPNIEGVGRALQYIALDWFFFKTKISPVGFFRIISDQCIVVPSGIVWSFLKNPGS